MRKLQTTLFLLFKRDIHNLEYDPSAQYRFHFFWTWFWFVSMPTMAVLIHPMNTNAWIQLSILEVSLWANFATHFGAMSAALAAKAIVRPSAKDSIETTLWS